MHRYLLLRDVLVKVKCVDCTHTNWWKKPKEKIVYFQIILYRKPFPIHLIKNFLEKQDAIINMTESNERLKQKQDMF